MSEIIVSRIRERLVAMELTPNAASLRVGTNRMLIADILSGKSKSPTAATLRKIADVLDSDIAYLVGDQDVRRVDGALHKDSPKLPQRPAGAFPITPHQIELRGDREMPIYGLAVGGEDGRFLFNGEVVGRTKVPPVLVGVNNAYGLYVAGESMVPRYMPGEEVWVNPHKTPVYGDDVIVQLYPEHDGEPPEGYVKQFRGYAGNRLLLFQWNPQDEYGIAKSLVKSVHVIVGRA